MSITEYLSGIKGITAKLNGYDFAYGFMAISDKGVALAAQIPEDNKSFSTANWKTKSYILKYSPEYMEQQASLKCGSPHFSSNNIQHKKMEGEAIGVESRVRSVLKSAPVYSFHDLTKEITIRLMYVYTSAAVENIAIYGRDRDHDVTLSMLESQLVLDNSKVGIKLDLVRVHEMEYGTALVEAILYNTVLKQDAKMNAIHTMRDTENIDIVIMVTRQPSGSIAGAAHVLDSFKGNRNLNGFTAINSTSTYGQYTVIHEIGHSLGCHHLIDQSSEPAPDNRLFEYGTAWKGIMDNGKGHITVMGYAYGGTSRIPYFSSPDITLKGTAIGNEQFSNNRLVLRQMKHSSSTYGKGMQVSPEFTFTEYGKSKKMPINITTNAFSLRPGDKIVCIREPGKTVGKYPIYAHIEDSGGDDVTDDIYYQGNIYIHKCPNN